MNDPLSSCSSSEPFALQVIGDSMEPEFPDASIVVIEPSDWCQHGMYIMALVEGVRWFRQYLKDDRGERLVALNDIYPEIELDGAGVESRGHHHAAHPAPCPDRLGQARGEALQIRLTARLATDPQHRIDPDSGIYESSKQLRVLRACAI